MTTISESVNMAPSWPDPPYPSKRKAKRWSPAAVVGVGSGASAAAGRFPVPGRAPADRAGVAAAEDGGAVDWLAGTAVGDASTMPTAA
jgi:hypothetical protein